MERWSIPIDIYCERTDPSFWAEPVNALTNAAFLIAAGAAFVTWRRQRADWPALVLIVVTGLIGIGSFIFHTVATRGAVLLDVIPISLFIFGYLFVALRRYLRLNFWAAFAIVVGFAFGSNALEMIVPRGFLNGSASYLPALVALIVVAALARTANVQRGLLAAAGVFAASLAFRTIDPSICQALPLGSHFLWHVLNGVVLYMLLQVLMAAGTAPHVQGTRLREVAARS